MDMKTRQLSIKTVFYMSIFCFICLIFGSCATSMRGSRNILEDTSQYQEFEPFRMDLGFDVFMLRVDLKRAVRTVTELTLEGEEQEVEREMPYSPLLIDLGEGIIMDLNGNLCIDLLRLYGLDRVDTFSIESRGTRAGNTHIQAEKTDGRYNITRRRGSPARDSGTIETFSSENDAETQSILLSEFTAVNRIKDSLGFRSLLTIKKESQNEAELNSRYGTFAVRLRNNELQLDRNPVLVHKGNMLETDGYSIVKSGNSIYVFDRLFRGFELRQDGMTVNQYVNGKLTRSYDLLSIE